MNMLRHKQCFKVLSLLAMGFCSVSAYSFELLSEGAMGSVSAISANTAEEIVNVAGPAAAGLVAEGYEALPFQVELTVGVEDTDIVSDELEFALTQEVDGWVQELNQNNSNLDRSSVQVGYIDVLPESNFQDTPVFVPGVQDVQRERIVLDPNLNGFDDEESTSFELGRIDQTITILEQNVDSVEFLIERRVEFAATINPNTFDGGASIGSGYITDLRAISRVSVASRRE